MRGAASNAIACTLMPSLSSIFFILWICVDSASILTNSHRTGTIRLESSRISWIRLYRPTIEMAEIGRNQLWMRSKRPRSILPQFYSEYLLLLLCFLFCFVLLAFENIFEMKRITYRNYVEKDVVCMRPQQWNIFVIICCLHAFLECCFACFQRMLFAFFPRIKIYFCLWNI